MKWMIINTSFEYGLKYFKRIRMKRHHDSIELVNGKWIYYTNKSNPSNSDDFGKWIVNIPQRYRHPYPSNFVYPEERQYRGKLINKDIMDKYLNPNRFWDLRTLPIGESIRVFTFDAYLAIKVERY